MPRSKTNSTTAPDLALFAQMHEHAGEAAQLMKALGNEQRLLVLCNLLERPLSVREINERVELSQSALSQHLAVLRDLELVETQRSAQSIVYSLPPGPVTRLMALLQEIYCSGPVRPGRARAKSAAKRVSPRGRAC